MLPLNDRNDDLWKGRPLGAALRARLHAPFGACPRPAAEPAQAAGPPPGRRWPWAVGLLALILVLCGGAVLLENTLRPHAFDWGGAPGQWEEQYHQAQYSTEPPSIPAAGPAEGVSLALHSAQGEPLTFTRSMTGPCPPSSPSSPSARSAITRAAASS